MMAAVRRGSQWKKPVSVTCGGYAWPSVAASAADMAAQNSAQRAPSTPRGSTYRINSSGAPIDGSQYGVARATWESRGDTTDDRAGNRRGDRGTLGGDPHVSAVAGVQGPGPGRGPGPLRRTGPGRRGVLGPPA